MSIVLDRRLTRLYRTVGGTLFLALCGLAAYTAGDRLRSAQGEAGGALISTVVVFPEGTCAGLDRIAPQPRTDRR